MTLQQQFEDTFKERDVITTKDIYNWYCSVKGGKSQVAYPTSIYGLVINPLLAKGIIIKITKGVYKLNHFTFESKVLETIEEQQEEMDEWDLYIKQKLDGKQI